VDQYRKFKRCLKRYQAGAGKLAAMALYHIGDRAVPALQRLVDSVSPADHNRAVRVLWMIRTPKALLREDLPRESDPSVEALIKRTVNED